jgi:signal recognition particle subunit SEC65
VNVAQRKKQARRMAKLAKSPAFQFKKKKALLKMRNPAKLHMAARKKTIQLYRDKFYPSYADMSLQQKVKIDQIIMAKYGSKIDKISKKVAMKLRKTEMERIKQARKNKSDA